MSEKKYSSRYCPSLSIHNHNLEGREDLSIDVSITNVGLILTKLWWLQLFVKSQDSNFELFWKKKN